MDIIAKHRGWYSEVVRGEMDALELAEIAIEYEEEIIVLRGEITRLVADVLAIAKANQYMTKNQREMEDD